MKGLASKRNGSRKVTFAAPAERWSRLATRLDERLEGARRDTRRLH